MQASSWLLWLHSLESIIDYSPLIVPMETSVLEAIALMATHNKSVLVNSDSQIVGYLTQQNIIELVASGANLHTITLVDVMQTPIKRLHQQKCYDLATVLTFLQEQQLKLILVVDDQEQIVGTITPESVLQVISATKVDGRGEQSTLEQLRLLESVVVNANDAILITEAQLLDEPKGPKIVYVNTAFTTISGYTAEEVIGKTPRILQGEQTSRVQLDKIRQALEAGRSIRTELANYHKNGSVYWVEVNIVPIADQEGKITHFVSIQRDITEYKRTEEALKLSEELFQQLTESIPQVFFVRDAQQQKLCYVSPAYEKIWGQSRDRLYDNWEDFTQSIHPLDRDYVIANLEKLEIGQPFDEEYRIIRPDGEIRWIADKVFPVINEAGEIYRYTGIAQDITEEKQHFEALRESEERFRILADTAPVLIWMSGNNAEYNFFNQAWLEFTGQTLEQTITNNWTENIHSEDFQIYADTYLTAFQNRQRFSLEYRLKRADGEYRWLLDTGIPRFTTHGGFVGYIGSCIDITEQKQAFEKLQESNNRLTLALEATNTFYWERNLQTDQVLFLSNADQPGAIQGMSYHQSLSWIHPDDLDRLMTATNAAIANGGNLEAEHRLFVGGNQAECKWFLARAKVLTDSTGQPERLVGVSIDIDYRVQAETALEQYNQELEKRVTERTTALQAINERLISEISDRQKIEEQLLQSRQMLQLVMDTIPHCVYWKDRHSVYLGCNRHFAQKIAGVEHPEAIFGKTDYDLFTDYQEDDIDVQVMNSNTPQYHIIKQHTQAEGQTIWLEANKVPLHDIEGNVVGILGTYEDITERQQAQSALAKSEARFRFLAEAIPQQVWIAHPNGSIEYVNQRTLDFFGCSFEQILGWKWQALVHPEDWPASIAAWNKSLATGENYEVEFRLLEKQSGKYRWHLARAFALRDGQQPALGGGEMPTFSAKPSVNGDSQGQIISWFGTNTDIDDRVSAEVALRESERRYHTIATVSPVGLFHTDPQGHFLYVNERWCELTGLTAETARGMGWINALHPEDLGIITREWYQAVKQRHTFRAEYRFRRSDGQISWVLSQAVPERTETGEIIAYVGTVTDISERKRAETALAERVKLADFRANVDEVLTQQETLESIMRGCTDAIVKYLGAALARIWLVNPQTQILELQVSSGIYTQINGEHSRIPIGQHKIGLIAQTGKPIITNSVDQDSPIHDQEGVQQQGIVAFAGYPLILEGETLGVIAMFSRQTLTESTFAAMGIAADEIAIGIKRKQTEAALRESEERFRNLVEASSDWIWEVDQNAVYTYISPKVSDILGYEVEEVLGKTPLDFMPQDRLAQIHDDFAAIFINPQPFQCLENYQIHRHGHLVILETSGVPVFDADGQFVGYRGMSRDITQRQQAAIALQETQQQLQAILDNSSAVMYVVDTENKFLLINRQYERLFNLTQEQMFGKGIEEFWPAQTAQEFIDNNQKVIATGVPIEAEEVVPHPDGLHTYLTVKFPLKDANGVIYAVGGISTDITDRKLVEESLLRLHKAIESTSDAIGMADITGQGIYLNPAFIELFEYNLEELQAAGGATVICKHPQEYQNILTTILAGESWRGEVTMQTRSGRNLQIYLRADAIKDANNKIVSIVKIYTDITQRKQAEESVRLRDRAIAASRNGIVIADVTQPTETIIYVNSAFERMTGYSAAEVIGRNMRSLPGVDLNQPGLLELSTAMDNGRDCTVTLLHYRKDGNPFWNELNISPVYDLDGCLTHYIGIQNDITERKQAETALLISQQRLQYLLSSSPAVIYASYLSKDNGIIFISENVSFMMGYEATEFTQDSAFWVNHVHPEDISQVLAETSQVLEQGQYSLEYRFLHQDGSYRWLYDQGKVIRDKAGNPLELVGYWADITNRKQLEQELRVALEKEKELNELKSRFISMTSHEFRTPLSTILSSSELLEHYRHKWTQEKQLIHLHRIQTAVKRMTEMLNDVLVIGRADAGKLEYRPSTFDLITYCYQLVEEVRLYSDQHQITFNSQYASLPCYMDDKLLGYILSNLLSNAIKYSPNGGLVSFTVTCENEQAILEIQDQGIGIPPEDLPRLFESFHRARNVGNIIGTGLGLSIVKKCVDIHQGKIIVNSIPGVGTKFTISLPLNNQISTEVSYA
ncbi:MAG TPA: PAS domain S-box protein [Nostocaceae cyanobacterium]|nr:PAS domain S-box protein [Nostocaceae cyanobacterium]